MEFGMGHKTIKHWQSTDDERTPSRNMRSGRLSSYRGVLRGHTKASLSSFNSVNLRRCFDSGQADTGQRQ